MSQSQDSASTQRGAHVWSQDTVLRSGVAPNAKEPTTPAARNAPRKRGADAPPGHPLRTPPSPNAPRGAVVTGNPRSSERTAPLRRQRLRRRVGAASSSDDDEEDEEGEHVGGRRRTTHLSRYVQDAAEASDDDDEDDEDGGEDERHDEEGEDERDDGSTATGASSQQINPNALGSMADIIRSRFSQPAGPRPREDGHGLDAETPQVPDGVDVPNFWQQIFDGTKGEQQQGSGGGRAVDVAEGVAVDHETMLRLQDAEAEQLWRNRDPGQTFGEYIRFRDNVVTNYNAWTGRGSGPKITAEEAGWRILTFMMDAPRDVKITQVLNSTPHDSVLVHRAIRAVTAEEQQRRANSGRGGRRGRGGAAADSNDPVTRALDAQRQETEAAPAREAGDGADMAFVVNDQLVRGSDAASQTSAASTAEETSRRGRPSPITLEPLPRIEKASRGFPLALGRDFVVTTSMDQIGTLYEIQTQRLDHLYQHMKMQVEARSMEKVQLQDTLSAMRRAYLAILRVIHFFSCSLHHHALKFYMSLQPVGQVDDDDMDLFRRLQYVESCAGLNFEAKDTFPRKRFNYVHFLQAILGECVRLNLVKMGASGDTRIYQPIVCDGHVVAAYQLWRPDLQHCNFAHERIGKYEELQDDAEKTRPFKDLVHYVLAANPGLWAKFYESQAPTGKLADELQNIRDNRFPRVRTEFYYFAYDNKTFDVDQMRVYHHQEVLAMNKTATHYQEGRDIDCALVALWRKFTRGDVIDPLYRLDYDGTKERGNRDEVYEAAVRQALPEELASALPREAIVPDDHDGDAEEQEELQADRRLVAELPKFTGVYVYDRQPLRALLARAPTPYLDVVLDSQYFTAPSSLLQLSELLELDHNSLTSLSKVFLPRTAIRQLNGISTAHTQAQEQLEDQEQFDRAALSLLQEEEAARSAAAGGRASAGASASASASGDDEDDDDAYGSGGRGGGAATPAEAPDEEEEDTGPEDKTVSLFSEYTDVKLLYGSMNGEDNTSVNAPFHDVMLRLRRCALAVAVARDDPEVAEAILEPCEDLFSEVVRLDQELQDLDYPFYAGAKVSGPDGGVCGIRTVNDMLGGPVDLKEVFAVLHLLKRVSEATFRWGEVPFMGETSQAVYATLLDVCSVLLRLFTEAKAVQPACPFCHCEILRAIKNTASLEEQRRCTLQLLLEHRRLIVEDKQFEEAFERAMSVVPKKPVSGGKRARAKKQKAAARGGKRKKHDFSSSVQEMRDVYQELSRHLADFTKEEAAAMRAKIATLELDAVAGDVECVDYLLRQQECFFDCTESGKLKFTTSARVLMCHWPHECSQIDIAKLYVLNHFGRAHYLKRTRDGRHTHVMYVGVSGAGKGTIFDSIAACFSPDSIGTFSAKNRDNFPAENFHDRRVTICTETATIMGMDFAFNKQIASGENVEINKKNQKKFTQDWLNQLYLSANWGQVPLNWIDKALSNERRVEGVVVEHTPKAIHEELTDLVKREDLPALQVHGVGAYHWFTDASPANRFLFTLAHTAHIRTEMCLFRQYLRESVPGTIRLAPSTYNPATINAMTIEQKKKLKYTPLHFLQVKFRQWIQTAEAAAGAASISSVHSSQELVKLVLEQHLGCRFLTLSMPKPRSSCNMVYELYVFGIFHVESDTRGIEE